ncbi:MAG: type IV secretory system conjugative DNA transfer family protein [Treponema sp.]|nr:type IV secretory system conjugative DNA transfer family protein [Treponema sp.]
MEESKELQGLYTAFRIAIYVSLFVEVFEYAIPPTLLEPIGSFLVDIQERMGQWLIYQPGHMAYSKITTLLLVAITCIGTKNKKQLEFNARKMVFWPIVIGFTFILLSVWFYNTEYLSHELSVFRLSIWLYILASVIGTVAVHVALDNVSKYLKDGMLKDRFNFENESFEQNEDFKETPYSVNIPMRYYYKGKFRHGWININNPFRGTFVVGTPGSGKTFSVIEPFIRQHSAKGFAMVVYDYKFPTLAQKLYYHYRKNQAMNKKAGRDFKFNIINFVNVEYSRRVNPIQHKYIDSLAAAQETAETLVESLQKGKKEGGGGADQFFQTSAVNFLAACIFFFVNYKRVPYDANGNELYPEYTADKDTKHKKLTGRVFDTEANRDAAEAAARNNMNYEIGLVEADHWLGLYSDMPHVLSFLNHDYKEIFEVLSTDPEVYPLLGPFKTAYENNAMEQLEGLIGTLRVQISRLATKEAYWIFHKDGDDFDLKVSDPKKPSYLLIANDPEKESIIGALNAMILNRLVTRVNSGQGKNVPVDICVDEVPTLYFHKIDRLIGTARSNKVSVILGFQELPQLEADYGKVGMQKIITTIGNVISGSARNKETLEWLSNDIFGKTVQLKKGVTIDRDRTSINLNENMDSMVPASKISDMPSGWVCGQVARDFTPTKTQAGFFHKRTINLINAILKLLHFKKRLKYNDSMNIQEAEEFQTSKFFCKTNFDMKEIKAEEDDYKNFQLPIFYKFKSKDARERILYANYERVNKDVNEMIDVVFTEFQISNEDSKKKGNKK